MDENEIMTDEVMDETFEESEEYTDEGGFPVIPTVIGGVLVAGVTALAVNRKKIAAKIAEKRAEHAKKVLDDYEKKSVLYQEVEKDSDDSE